MSRESFLYPLSRTARPVTKLSSARWRAIFQILTVIGMILVLVSLVLLLQGSAVPDACLCL